MKYIYPNLPAKITTPWIRLGGNGLANCLFVYAKAIVLAHKYKAQLITPAWCNLSIGTYIRHQSDKRHYMNLFKNINEVAGFKKIVLLLFSKKTKDVDSFDSFNKNSRVILIQEGIYDFFKPLISYHTIVKEYILSHIRPELLNSVNKYDFSNCIAVHIRLGDYPQNRRIPMEWYLNKISLQGEGKKVLLFSDGKDDELTKILSLKNVERANFGGAIQDIIAMSKCSYVIGSDSSFSAWGVFLGQVPSVFYKLQFGNVLINSKEQIIENN